MKKTKKLLLFVLVFGLLFTNTATVNAATKINKKTTTIYVGQTTTLKISGTKSKVTWSSSKKSVATVTSKGKVTAKKKGTATITAKVGSKKYTCKVTVKNPYLNKTKLSLNQGKTYTLKLTGSKVKAWTSSNKKVATVSSKGKITAKKGGTTTITAKDSNGKKYTCKVTVKATAKNTETSEHTHKYTSKVTKQPTCTENGVRTYTCSCGDSYTKAISATGHTWSDWKVTKKATETATGLKERTCSVCGKTESQTIAKLDHTHKYTSKVTKQPTCTESGIKTYTCSCGDSYTESVPATGQHSWDNGKVTKEPTCIDSGIKTYTCTVCGQTKTETLTATGHNYNTVVTEPTCTEDGYTAHTCSRCGDTYKDSFVDTLEHNYEWVVTKEPTCTENGIKVCQCIDCGDVIGQTEIAATHSYGDWTVTKEPSNEAATTAADFGTRQRTCSVCNHVDEQTIINIDLGDGETKQMYGVFDDDMAYETFDMVNELRTSLGLNELTWFDNFSDIAHIRAVEINHLFEHTRPNGSGTVRYDISGSLSVALGENIAMGPTLNKAQLVFDGWCNSSGHYANITKTSYKKYYCSCFITYDVNGNPWYNWVQLFY